MKKFILLISLTIFLTACQNKNDIEKEIKTKENPPIYNIEETEEKDTYIDNNEIILGLYLHKNSKRELITDYYDSCTKLTDIGSFEVLYTKDSIIDGNNFKELFNQYYNNYQNSDQYKIGYHIHFSLNNGEVIDKNILKPEDAESFYNYIQVYLYDDIHQGDGFYSHVETKDYNENTLLTSIKLTASIYIDEVISPIQLSAFTYNQDDFNEEGTYRGKSIYSINVIRQ